MRRSSVRAAVLAAFAAATMVMVTPLPPAQGAVERRAVPGWGHTIMYDDRDDCAVLVAAVGARCEYHGNYDTDGRFDVETSLYDPANERLAAGAERWDILQGRVPMSGTVSRLEVDLHLNLHKARAWLKSAVPTPGAFARLDTDVYASVACSNGRSYWSQTATLDLPQATAYGTDVTIAKKAVAVPLVITATGPCIAESLHVQIVFLPRLVDRDEVERVGVFEAGVAAGDDLGAFARGRATHVTLRQS